MISLSDFSHLKQYNNNKYTLLTPCELLGCSSINGFLIVIIIEKDAPESKYITYWIEIICFCLH
ncbi:hypothetical protein DERP_004014 [Dermatophagoides pteronyssinus]|uniref:Uncharacterized protein n=1 Tax=Dermatophagoides pteronyssinus TaxID=6956 RepID=A0ABQ8J7X5_DERPT|nr:hypothetical protein DERP_004014 [Dermatophagoides pteronyssinus]